MAGTHAKKNQWVVRHPDGWAVKGEGNSKATKVTKTQKEAIEAAIDLARKQGSEVVVQNRHGQIRLKEQQQSLKALLAKWDSEPDETSDEWWSDFEAFLRSEQNNVGHE